MSERTGNEIYLFNVVNEKSLITKATEEPGDLYRAIASVLETTKKLRAQQAKPVVTPELLRKVAIRFGEVYLRNEDSVTREDLAEIEIAMRSALTAALSAGE